MSAPVAPAVLGEPVPDVCTVRDVLRHLRMSRATFDRLMARGELQLIELTRLGSLRRFRGESVAALKRSRFAPQNLRRVG